MTLLLWIEVISIDLVFRCFDLDADNYIGYEEYIKGMSVYLKGKYEDKLKCISFNLVCFRVYDLNGDRYISKEEMFQMLKNCLIKEAVEEDEDGVKDLVDLVLKKLDEDRDGRVSEADWAGAIAKETLLMEAFGKCLPTVKEMDKYMNATQDEILGGSRSLKGSSGKLPVKSALQAMGSRKQSLAV